MVAIDHVDTELAALYCATDSGAAYERVKQLIVAQINAGKWREGDQIPSENQLVTAVGLSRMTINRALRDLTSDGVLTRVMGVGTFVAPSKASSPLFEVRNIADEIAQRGHRFRTVVEFVRAEDAAGSPLDDAVRDTVFHSLLVHYEENLPIQLEDRYVNPIEIPDYLSQDFTTVTPNTYLSAVAPLVRGEHIVEAILPSTTEAQLLGISRTEPCLLINRKTWSSNGLVSAARLVHPGSRSRLEGSFGS